MRIVITCALALLLAAPLVGCEEDGPAERTGERIDETADEAEDELEEFGREIGEAGDESNEAAERLRRQAS